jgi:hypothetical protein
LDVDVLVPMIDWLLWLKNLFFSRKSIFFSSRHFLCWPFAPTVH